MRLGWQCPTCFAELGDKSDSAMCVCPFCGSLLIVDKEKEKFYLAKKDNGWYFFRKKYLGDNDGYAKLSTMEILFRRENGLWTAEIEGERYMIGQSSEDCGEESSKIVRVEELWGDIPILLMPGMEIRISCGDKIKICTSRGSYVLERY